jgi:putative lipase involved disintegration of autophagic bodies
MAPMTEAQKRASKKWIEKNKEKKKAYMKKWQEENFEHYREQSRVSSTAYYYRNREELCRKRREKYLLECIEKDRLREEDGQQDLETNTVVSDITDWTTVNEDPTISTLETPPQLPPPTLPTQKPPIAINHPLFRIL